MELTTATSEKAMLLVLKHRRDVLNIAIEALERFVATEAKILEPTTNGVVEERPPRNRLSDRSIKILRACANSPYHTEQLAKVVKDSPSRINGTISNLRSRGSIRMTPKGYVTTERGMTQLERLEA